MIDSPIQISCKQYILIKNIYCHDVKKKIKRLNVEVDKNSTLKKEKVKNKKEKDSPSHTGNRTRATAVRAPDPNH